MKQDKGYYSITDGLLGGGFFDIITSYLPSTTKLRRLCFYTCLSFCPRGGITWAGPPRGPGTRPSWAGTPPPPPDQVHTPQTRYPPGTGTHPGPGTTPSQQTATAADGTHPTGMHSCFFFIFMQFSAKVMSSNRLHPSPLPSSNTGSATVYTCKTFVWLMIYTLVRNQQFVGNTTIMSWLI